jgi:hypothetical protein
MQIVIWYPASADSRAPRTLRDYVELSAGTLGVQAATTERRRQLVEAFATTPLSNGITRSAIDAVLGAPMRAHLDAPRAAGRFPLVVFLHASPWGASVMSEYLASHGLVVAAIESKGAREPAYRLSRENLDAMVADAAFTLARLRGEPNVAPQFGVIGMSNGSIAALALQLSGTTPGAVVSLDGGIGERAGGTYLGERLRTAPTTISVPLLHLYSPDNPHLDFQYLRSYEASPRILIRVGRLRHGDFLAGGALERALPGAFGTAPAEASTGFEFICRYTLNFLRWRLAADERSRRFIAAQPEANGAPTDLLTVERLP